MQELLRSFHQSKCRLEALPRRQRSDGGASWLQLFQHSVRKLRPMLNLKSPFNKGELEQMALEVLMDPKLLGITNSTGCPRR